MASAAVVLTSAWTGRALSKSTSTSRCRPSPMPPSVLPLSCVAYMEPAKAGAFGAFLHRLQGSLPIVGLIARLASDEGGVGDDRLRFQEFCSRVDKRLSQDGRGVFQEFERRFGRVSIMFCFG